MNALVEAILAGDATTALAVVQDPETASGCGPDGTPALLLAHYRGMGQVVEAIRRERNDELSLAEAAAIGALELVAMRLAGGTPPDERSPDGFTPLQLAAHFDQAAAAALLVRSGADLTARAQGALTVQALHAAAASRTGSCLPLLVAAGAPLDDPQDRGFRALHEVALRGQAAHAWLLLAAGADASLADDEGRKAADHADAGGHPEVAAMLRGRARH